MNQSFEYVIQDFDSKSNENILIDIFTLNQANIPEVGNLQSLSYFKKLLTNISTAKYILCKNEVIGFVVCFREASNYASENYKFFSTTEKSFLYIDRIAICDRFRRNNLANELYKTIEQECITSKIPLCCEVNLKPLNQPSINFHEKFGFVRVGKQQFKENTVAYFKKEYI